MQQVNCAPGLPRHLGTCCSFLVEPRRRPSEALPESGRLDALVVLGCRVRAGHPSRTLESRLELALELSQGALGQADSPPAPIVLSGGRLWDGVREADVMAEWLIARGVARQVLVLEGDSLTTGQNARRVASLLSVRGWRRVGLVTSDFHMRRAVRLFRREGVVIVPFGARTEVGFFTEKRLVLRELCAFVLGHFEPR
jgi:uncharacterized SAM-binding protein YcdF (DUF218 family)